MTHAQRSTRFITPLSPARRRRVQWPWLACAALCSVVWLSPLRAAAEAEPLDKTRLDVERLPPEALPLSRDMYDVGFHVRAELGVQGFAYGIGRLSTLGPVAHIALGYEFTSWFLLAADFGLGMHGTDAPPPPAATAFQTYTALLQARFTLPLSLRSALWLSLDGGGALVSGNFFEAYGFERADSLGFAYGGGLGFDWHFLNPHHSIGLKAASHLYPNLIARNHEQSVAIEGAAYLKYVF